MGLYFWLLAILVNQKPVYHTNKGWQIYTLEAEQLVSHKGMRNTFSSFKDLHSSFCDSVKLWVLKTTLLNLSSTSCFRNRTTLSDFPDTNRENMSFSSKFEFYRLHATKATWKMFAIFILPGLYFTGNWYIDTSVAKLCVFKMPTQII